MQTRPFNLDRVCFFFSNFLSFFLSVHQHFHGQFQLVTDTSQFCLQNFTLYIYWLENLFCIRWSNHQMLNIFVCQIVHKLQDSNIESTCMGMVMFFNSTTPLIYATPHDGTRKPSPSLAQNLGRDPYLYTTNPTKCTHTLEEFKLVKISSNLPQETRFTNNTDIGILSELSIFNSSHRNWSEIVGNAQNKNNGNDNLLRMTIEMFILYCSDKHFYSHSQ